MSKNLRAIDLFAGAGGFSTGATQAGAKIVFAINHWEMAVKFHSANHPGAQHVCQDINLMNWVKLPKYDLMCASPCCTAFSKARGGREYANSNELRQLPWCITHALKFSRPRFLIIENVPEFMQWDEYDLFKIALQRKGYHITENLLNAKDFGVPQSRERLFLVGSLDGAVTIKTPGIVAPAAKDIIEWNHPSFRPINAKPRADIVMRQIRNGRKVHGDRFLVVYNGSENKGRSVEKPMPTITCSDRIAVVNGDKIRFLRASEARRAMGFPEGYQLPHQHREALRMLGNAVCPPVAKSIVEQLVAA